MDERKQLDAVEAAGKEEEVPPSQIPGLFSTYRPSLQGDTLSPFHCLTGGTVKKVGQPPTLPLLLRMQQHKPQSRNVPNSQGINSSKPQKQNIPDSTGKNNLGNGLNNLSNGNLNILGKGSLINTGKDISDNPAKADRDKLGKFKAISHNTLNKDGSNSQIMKRFHQVTTCSKPPAPYDPENPFNESLSVEEMARFGGKKVLKDPNYIAVWLDFEAFMATRDDKPWVAFMGGHLSNTSVDKYLSAFLAKRVNKTELKKVNTKMYCS